MNPVKYNLIQNNQAVKKSVVLKKAMVKRCKIQGGGHEMVVMVG